ncbi:hypothetical protein SM764_17015 [Pseudophaeobacter sp. 1A16562]|uniref:hypothetical protein n=1 Tax=Pseudophaeobacter sp. 1A16562 TaxID=3098143 RepID=UPI0034D69D57
MLKKAAFVICLFSPTLAFSQNCRTLCEADDPKCLTALNPKSADAGDIASAFAELYQALADPDIETIPSQDLMAMFGVTDDPCFRSDTSISTLPPEDGDVGKVHHIFNSGGTCRVSASVNLPAGFELAAGILVPDVVELDYVVNEDSIVITPFVKGRKSTAYFSDEDFNIDFGGVIRQIDFSPEYTIIDTDESCIALFFGEEQ